MGSLCAPSAGTILNVLSDQTHLGVDSPRPPLAGTSHPDESTDENGLLCCAGTDLTHLLKKKAVRAWCCGHTHYNYDFLVENGNRLLSNQRGYKNDLTLGYNPSFVVEI